MDSPIEKKIQMLRIHVAALAFTMLVFAGCNSKPTTNSNPTTTDNESAEKGTTTEAGKNAAAQDIAAGKLVLRRQNLPYPPGQNKYTKLLKERCGFTFKMISGKLTEVDYAYNEAMESEAKRKYGSDIFVLLTAEAKKNFEQGR